MSLYKIIIYAVATPAGALLIRYLLRVLLAVFLAKISDVQEYSVGDIKVIKTAKEKQKTKVK